MRYVYTSGNYIGLMDQEVNLSGNMTSSPVLQSNAYVWRFNDGTGAAKMAEPNFKVIPNSSSGQFQLLVDKYENIESVRIYSLDGKLIFELDQMTEN